MNRFLLFALIAFGCSEVKVNPLDLKRLQVLEGLVKIERVRFQREFIQRITCLGTNEARYKQFENKFNTTISKLQKVLSIDSSLNEAIKQVGLNSKNKRFEFSENYRAIFQSLNISEFSKKSFIETLPKTTSRVQLQLLLLDLQLINLTRATETIQEIPISDDCENWRLPTKELTIQHQPIYLQNTSKSKSESHPFRLSHRPFIPLYSSESIQSICSFGGTSIIDTSVKNINIYSPYLFPIDSQRIEVFRIKSTLKP